MITLSTQNTCTNIKASSQLIEDFILGNSVNTLTVTSIINCCSEHTCTFTFDSGTTTLDWEVEIDIDHDDTVYNNINSLSFLTETGIVEIMSGTYSILDGIARHTDMDALESTVNAWLVSNSISGTFAVTLSNGNSTNSLVTLTYTGVDVGFNPTTAIVVTDTATMELVDDFYQTSLTSSNCNGVEVNNGFITLNDVFYGFDEGNGLKDGVYQVSITAVYSDASIKKEHKCILVDCATKCLLVDYLLCNDDTNVHYKYDAVRYGEVCNDCDCENMCALWKEVLSAVRTLSARTTINTSVFVDCGCS